MLENKQINRQETISNGQSYASKSLYLGIWRGVFSSKKMEFSDFWNAFWWGKVDFRGFGNAFRQTKMYFFLFEIIILLVNTTLISTFVPAIKNNEIKREKKYA